MKIYVTHPTNFDFKTELYKPLRDSELNKNHEIILPHETSERLHSTPEFIRDCDLVLAEVSLPSTGQGIELGWATIESVPVICFYKAGAKYSYSLKAVSDIFLEYNSADELIEKLTQEIEG